MFLRNSILEPYPIVNMEFIERLLHKLGLTGSHARRHPIRIFLLEDDKRRCEWFAKRFKGDELDVACDVSHAKELLQTRTYDSIFLDHDLMPEHYGSTETDDERTGYAIASFLASRPELQRPATIVVHSSKGVRLSNFPSAPSPSRERKSAGASVRSLIMRWGCLSRRKPTT